MQTIKTRKNTDCMYIKEMFKDTWCKQNRQDQILGKKTKWPAQKTHLVKCETGKPTSHNKHLEKTFCNVFIYYYLYFHL